MSALFGKVTRTKQRLFVAMGDSSSSAKAFAASRINLSVLGREDVVEVILDHYDHLESACRADMRNGRGHIQPAQPRLELLPVRSAQPSLAEVRIADHSLRTLWQMTLLRMKRWMRGPPRGPYSSFAMGNS